MNLTLFSIFLLGLFIKTTHQQSTFKNPIFDGNSADPAVIRIGNFYYLTLSENRETELTIFKSPNLTNFRNVEKKIAYKVPTNFTDLWASEMHLVNGELYIYFTMSETGIGHRMYAIQAEDPNNPMGNWGQPILLIEDSGNIDGTPFVHSTSLYFVWANFDPIGLSLWIAPMLNATFVNYPRIILRQPKESYECEGGCVNEGPYFIYRNTTSYLIFSMSSTWNPNYSLGLMTIESDKNPMNITDWNDLTAQNGGPIFWRNDAEQVYTTGHATFTTSPDGTETWMVYHATDSTIDIDGNRIARIEKIEWNNKDRMPIFPRPHGFNTSLPVPSGQI